MLTSTGSIAFDYTVADGNGGSDTATVTITVNDVNDAPTSTAIDAQVIAMAKRPSVWMYQATSPMSTAR
jgi:hypothetical protein